MVSMPRYTTVNLWLVQLRKVKLYKKYDYIF
jgi:hypothetical protein